jgi:4-hydroxybenzoate polyprenyltransferase
MKTILELFRVHQYIKNVFIFAPLIFVLDIKYFLNDGWIYSLVAFVLFSLTASGIYIFNDLMDLDEDREHPTKKNRAIASKKISVPTAIFIMVGLIGISIGISFFVNINLFYVLGIYFLLNIAYSIKLKHVAVLDVFIIATGFVLRLFAGSSVGNIPLSHWIIVVTFLLAIFLAIAKRRDDVLLAMQGKNTRKNIDGYNLEFVNAAMVLMAGIVTVSYILYSISEEVVAKIGTDKLYLTSFFVILGILRYMQITFVEENSGSPTKVVLKDTFLKITLVLWFSSFIFIAVFLPA